MELETASFELQISSFISEVLQRASDPIPAAISAIIIGTILLALEKGGNENFFSFLRREISSSENWIDVKLMSASANSGSRPIWFKWTVEVVCTGGGNCERIREWSCFNFDIRNAARNLRSLVEIYSSKPSIWDAWRKQDRREVARYASRENFSFSAYHRLRSMSTHLCTM